ncbi:hypothetical protein ACMU_15000 [Actibacterium mucosum KCTC 23349]|uniref:Peptidase S54 rhomboid domain-containing protein n=1 Tax=Actibacterium mucosum KCTC 23349 TaxID=1454373 RepID=A0A037ZJQ8_9RHOB|nr:rhomboid family intramembrane serine protease [Actibacterium mucosum]KAJ55061.1 hypothetical protein ACMU_15000 [Actibacterium mucosum KCTC 23349]
MSDAPHNNAFNPLPTILWVLALPAIAVEVVLSLAKTPFITAPGADAWRGQVLQDYAFFAQAQQWMFENGQFPAELMIRYVSYPFIHPAPLSTVFSLVFLLALGNMVARIFAVWAVVVIYLTAAIFGAFVFGVLVTEGGMLAGGFPASYGLIGAYTFILWVNLAATGGQQSQAFTLIAFLMGLQLLFGIMFDSTPDWIADLAGFVAGFGLSFLVCPGGFRNAVAMIRRRGK